MAYHLRILFRRIIIMQNCIFPRFHKRCFIKRASYFLLFCVFTHFLRFHLTYRCPYIKAYLMQKVFDQNNSARRFHSKKYVYQQLDLSTCICIDNWRHLHKNQSQEIGIFSWKKETYIIIYSKVSNFKVYKEG